MTRSAAPEIVRRALMRHGFVGASDATLLVRYSRHHDDAAFAELVERYAPLVWGVCRRACSDTHAAEDAFQTTFIALARQAASLRRPECLPGWLHGVARRAAWRARTKARTVEPISDVPGNRPAPIEQASANELLAAVEAEVAQLPEKYRSAVLLCWFEDGSLDDAAHRLGVSKGVLWGRLKRGRERLRQRLTARGFGPAVVLAAAVLTGTPAAAQLIRRATAAAVAPAATTSPLLLGSWAFWKLGAVLGIVVAVAITAVTLMSAGAPEPSKDPPSKTPATAEVAIDDGFPLPAGAVRRFGNRQLRHTGGIAAATISPDGKLLATASREGVVVWDLKSLSAKRSFPQIWFNHNTVYARGGQLQFLPDCKGLLVGLRPVEGNIWPEGNIVDLAQVWDVETGKKRFGISGRTDFYSATWLTAGGKECAVVANTGVDTELRFFDVRDGKPLRTVKAPHLGNPPWIGPGGNVIAVQGQDGPNGSVLDVATGKELFGFPEQPSQIAFSRDGKLCVWVGRAGVVHVQDLEAKKERFTFEHPEKDKPGPMAVSADNKTLYFSSNHGRLFRWDLVNNTKGPDFGNRHNFWSLTALVLDPEETTLYSTAADHLVKRWDLKTGNELPLPTGYTTHISQVVAADGKHLILTDHEGQVDYWDLATGKRTKQLQASHLGGINCLVESADGRWLAGGRTSQDVRLFDLSTGKVVRDMYLGDNSDARWGDLVERVKFDAAGQVLFSTSRKTGLTAWEIPAGKKIWNVPATGPLLSVDPKGRWLATSRDYGDNPPVQWSLLNAKNGELVARIDVEIADVRVDGQVYQSTPYLNDIAWLPDGSRLVTVHYDGTIRVWDPETRKEVLRLIGGKLGVATTGLGVSADGRWIAVSGSDRSVTVWELATGKKMITLAGHESAVTEVAFTRDGRGLVSNADLSPVLWDLCPKDLPTDGLWDLLASDDAAKAYRAQWALIRDPAAAVKLLRETVKPAELAVSRVTFDKWVAALDNSQFRAREAAEKELMQAGANVPISWLRKALADSKADEPRARLTRVLAQREKGRDPNAWRLARAVQVLELAATPEAGALLKEWSKVEGSPLADDVAGALQRLKK
jgi:RNA polymerase sigma factor (sigma-70 family)